MRKFKVTIADLANDIRCKTKAWGAGEETYSCHYDKYPIK
jgi:hypothetical protein